MNDPRPLLIFLRCAVGLALLTASAFFALGFLEARLPQLVAGSAVAAIATFCCGLYFLEQGLATHLWTPTPPGREKEAAGELPAYGDVRIERKDV